MRFLLDRRVVVDGVGLATDVYLPEGPGSFPVLVLRTPYHKTHEGYLRSAAVVTARGYGFVVQDVRGKYDSEGSFRPMVDDGVDGRATIEWVAEQRWCNGRIGLWGRSYEGMVQLPAAVGGHEALGAIAPSVCPASHFRDFVRHDGCFALANLVQWTFQHATTRTVLPVGHFSWDDIYGLSPDAMAEAVGIDSPVLRQWARRDRYDEYWAGIDQDRMHPQVRVPGYHAGGWFDHLTRGQFDAYTAIRDRGATPAARRGQRLLIGPWGHANIIPGGPDRRRYGDWDFGPAADIPVLAQELQFFDYHLRDIDAGFTSQPPVRVFVMGTNQWQHLEDWPPPDATDTTWYLTSGGSANMGSGDGTLTRHQPQHERADVYHTDPTDPVPTLGGPVFWGLPGGGPRDQRPILNRPDVLYYRSDPLDTPLHVLGPVAADLWITSTAQDTDLIAKLCVEDDTGAVTALTYGSLRCRYRNSYTDPQPLPPGETIPLHLHLGHTAYHYRPGTRIGLIITSTDYPRIQPNPGHITPPWETTTHTTTTNTIHHGPHTPTALHLHTTPT